MADEPTLFEPEAPAQPDTVRLRLLVAYHGASFHGIAPQPRQRTVGGELATALGKILRQEPPRLTVSGRTDTGVHGWGQVVHADVVVPASGVDVVRIRRSLNKLLNPQVAVRSVDVAPEGFDARFSAQWRRYRYTVCNRPVLDPFLAATTWHVVAPLDLRAMQLACPAFLGEHDFTSFCRGAEDADGQSLSLVRRVTHADWEDLGDGILRFEIQASSFCRQMVRAITGMMIEIGLHKRTAGEVLTVLRARDRAAAAPLAPPQGLCLWQVGYPEGMQLADS